jgi:hypothetical protein
MKVGVLESRDDQFIGDVLAKLRGVETEFITFSNGVLPTHSDYRVVIDRASYRHAFLREAVKYLSLRGAYVVNNPFAASATNKMLDIKIGRQLGIPFPKTLFFSGSSGLEESEGMIAKPTWEEIVAMVGLPCVVKPFDGFAWKDVRTANSLDELKQTCAALESRPVLLIQQLIKYVDYYRLVCIDKKDVLFIKWNPRPLGLGEYLHADLNLLGPWRQTMAEQTVRLNVSLDLDVNAVEWCIDDTGQAWVIDAFNDVPEFSKEHIPEAEYAWIVDRFAACVADKLDSLERNRNVPPIGDDSSALFRLYPPPSS